MILLQEKNNDINNNNSNNNINIDNTNENDYINNIYNMSCEPMVTSSSPVGPTIISLTDYSRATMISRSNI